MVRKKRPDTVSVGQHPQDVARSGSPKELDDREDELRKVSKLLTTRHARAGAGLARIR